MKNYILKNKLLVALALVTGGIYAVLSAYISIALRDVIDSAMVGDEAGFSAIMYYTIVLLLSIGISYFLHALFSKRFIIQVVRNLRKDVFVSILGKNYRDFNAVNTADYISSLTNDIKLIEENYFVPLFLCLNSVVLFIASFIIMVSLSIAVTVCLFISMIFMIVIPSLFQKVLQNRQDLYSRKLANMTIAIKDFLSGYQIIRSYQMKNHVHASFQDYNNETMDVKYAWEKINASVEAVSALLGSVVQCSVLFLSAYLIIKGELSAGTLVGLVQISGMIALPIQTISTNLPKVQGTKLVIDKLLTHIHYESSTFTGKQIPTFYHHLQFNDVTFAYEANVPILQNVDLVLEQNKKYVFIGKSGCGKTTLINLLTGNFDQYSGKIYYDDMELSNLDIDKVSEMSAVIHQNVYMFDDTIEHNINLYKAFTDEQIHYALETSGVSTFLNEQKDLQTQVGENGANLSGGQRQRIAVARALVQKKPLLILDEGTSAIDKQTAYDIESKLLSLDDVTIITITHNLNPELLKHYDEIIFMDQGRIIEQGSFKNLLEQQGAFSQFYELKIS